MPDATVLNVAHLPSQAPDRQGRMDVVITYQIAGRGTPSALVLPEETFSEAELGRRIAELERRAGSLVGRNLAF